MKDFYCEVERALREKTVKELLFYWNADPNIKLSVSSKPVFVSKQAYYKCYSGYDSLEHIIHRSRKTNLEIPFAGIFDEKKMLVTDFIKGVTGDSGLCDWEAGLLLKKSYERAKCRNMKVVLGHTHPRFVEENGDFRSYGAICSGVYWIARDLKSFKSQVCRVMLESGLYKKYGGDYCEMFVRAWVFGSVSKFFWILAPRSNQIGIFEIEAKGNVIYHPWQVQN